MENATASGQYDVLYDFQQVSTHNDLILELTSGNLTQGLREGPLDQANRWLQVYVLMTLAALGFVGNVLIIVILCTKRLVRKCFTHINFLILQLAISDFLVVAFCLFADAVWKATYCWLAGDFMCRFVKYMQMFSLYASTFIIVTISLDRCIAILSPISRLSHHRMMKVISLGAWILAALCSIPQIFIFSVQKAPFPINDIAEFHQCVTHGAYTEEWQEPAYIVFTFCIMFAAPLLLIIPNYILIFTKLARESRMSSVPSVIPENSRPGLAVTSYKRTSSPRLNSGSFSVGNLRRDLLMRKAKTKALCISILVIVTFIFCWAPYYVCMIYYVIVSKDRSADPSAQYMFQIIFFFGMSASVLNPVLYGAFHMVNKSQSCWKKCFGHRRSRPSAKGSFCRRESTMGPHYNHHAPIEPRLSSLSTQRVASFDSAYQQSGLQATGSVRRCSYHPVVRVVAL